MNKTVAIIGFGFVGKAYGKMFPEAVIYDEPLKLGLRSEVNKCDLAIVCVPTNLKEDGTLDMSIVEDVVNWLETPLILIKSALMPGTTDRLADKYKKNLAVSVEMIGEGKYFIPFWKFPEPTNPQIHDMLIVGGDEETASACAEILWERMSPDIKIHLVTAVEAELCKLMENAWGALKVTFSNTIFDAAESLGANFIRVLQAWGSDGRTEKMHMRTVSYKRGWKSKCWDKDVVALATITNSPLLKGLLEANQEHLKNNE